MATILLVRHSLPEIQPNVPSPRWTLSAEGRRRCGWLAHEARWRGVAKLYASLEPKALETAALVAVELRLAIHPREGLQESDRSGLGVVSADELRDLIRGFFERPAELVMGTETAEAAGARFEAAVRRIAGETGEETIAIVTHGTVLTNLVARRSGAEPYAFWRALGLPAIAPLARDSLRLDGEVLSFPGAPDAN